ncbi:division/cell wall cluster transcriptional repressor MraZ [Fimbriimonas ginsengisoli]|uniref:MraZ protein n=1 Tax=Fimbriimonas ginsengisoli Gsoil 348 TaxID=661478 RepID=A0A068NLQ6_FIMGI|nr:division/cell wall cluster transcriptional repressor MraZ [Fimbriimonas ginsengisoli]AIE83695.1 MraZ protein [Fimbriimonas ginsengisoli Gsoil 348]
MNSLLGQYEIELEDDGRLRLPPRFAAILTPRLVAWLTPYRAIRVASRDEALEAVAEHGFLHVQVDLGSDGYLPIPADLARDAGLTADALVIGMGRFFEIWSREEYAIFSQEHLR